MSSDYCVEADIVKIFGATNVGEWANIDNDGALTADRITEAIDEASDEFDEVARQLGWQIPVVDPSGSTPQRVKNWAAGVAGLWLYESRGAQDYDRDGFPKHGHAWRRRSSQQYLAALLKGTRKLDVVGGR